MEETLANLQALDGDQVAAACRTTLSILVQNAMENVENKIFEAMSLYPPYEFISGRIFSLSDYKGMSFETIDRLGRRR